MRARVRTRAGTLAIGLAIASALAGALPSARAPAVLVPAALADAPAEPPADAPEGEDYEVERADTLSRGEVEVGLGYAGAQGSAVSQRRRIAFHGDSLDAWAREGAHDALTGASLEGAVAGGRFGVGRALPAWGRGLVLGVPREPWAPGDQVTSRRADGDAAWFRRAALGVWAGSVGKHPHLGLSAGGAGAGAGAAVGRDGFECATLWAARGDRRAESAAEVAADARGRWRAEIAAARRVRGAAVSLVARGGTRSFHGLADPRRNGPPVAVTVRARGDRPRAGRSNLMAMGTLWRFAPELWGARGVLEVERPLAQHASAVVGFEEQHGVRRDPQVAGGSAPAAAFREGAWLEGRAFSGPLVIAWRHERWGGLPWARAAVRVTGTARAGIESRKGFGVRVTHTTFRARGGEHVYLTETQSDRLVLRAYAGDGERTRTEIRCPFAGGQVLVAVDRGATTSRAPRVRWSLEWTRRARLTREP